MSEIKTPSIKLQRKVAEALGWTGIKGYPSWRYGNLGQVCGQLPDSNRFRTLCPYYVQEAIEARGWAWVWGSSGAFIWLPGHQGNIGESTHNPGQHRDTALYKAFVRAVKKAGGES